ncbi:hypothetical protein [Amycolatopsis sp. cmx-11-51]|uniref:hypothetical protein n=1 Tax=Amycolatopsis sp. cmx-11-51 TaxID=2785797 RepID=UPI0039E721C9
MPDAGCRMPDAGCRMPDAFRVLVPDLLRFEDLLDPRRASVPSVREEELKGTIAACDEGKAPFAACDAEKVPFARSSRKL